MRAHTAGDAAAVVPVDLQQHVAIPNAGCVRLASRVALAHGDDTWRRAVSVHAQTVAPALGRQHGDAQHTVLHSLGRLPLLLVQLLLRLRLLLQLLMWLLHFFWLLLL